MNCGCIERVDAKLKEKGLQLEVFFGLGGSKIDHMLPLHTIPVYDWQETGLKRKPKPVSIAASFCPFCGVSAKVGQEVSA